MISEAILNEIEELRRSGLSVEIQDEGNIVKLTIIGFPLPEGYTKDETDLLLQLPISYPNGKPDMFWVEEDVVLENGNIPRKANKIELLLGKKWRRFSWHLSSNWNPGRDDLNIYLSFVKSGLLKARE